MSGPREVGPVLQDSELGRAVAAAILESNEAARVQDRGAYLRISVPVRCFVSRAAIERQLGRAVQFPSELELVMTSFAGRLSIDAERAMWEAPEP